MDENSKAALQLDQKELYFLVAKFLEASPCQEAAKVLKAEITRHQLLPPAKNWLGQERILSYTEVEKRHQHVGSHHLQLVCSKLLNLLEHHGYQETTRLNSLLGSGTSRSISGSSANPEQRGSGVLRSAGHVAQKWKELLLESRCQPTTNFCNLVLSRSISTNFSPHLWRSPWLYERFTELHTILGHLAPVFCVLFDHTGQRIVTGADDDLLKVWSSRSGQLLATLRGHSAEVTDMSLSPDNTMIASGSLDKTVRVWCARSSAPIAVLLGHQGHVTSVQFSPAADEDCRYLASTGKDGCLCFWPWLPDQETFSSSPIKFMEKNRMGDQTLCSAFSSGGKYFVTGGTDHILRVYLCIHDSPTLHSELEGHKGRIMSVQFGNTGETVFATGSCDATARIWRYIEGKWTSIVLEVPAEEMSCKQSTEKPQVTMVGWEKTDTYMVTAFSPDCLIRVWESSSGKLVKKLIGHSGEVFVLEVHPTDSRILLTAGHDGLVVVWDMLAGQCLQKVEVKGEDGNPASIFDCRFSPDGLMCAAVDMNGYLTLMGFGSNDQYIKHPREQFFHTDYRPLMRDNHHYVVDEQSQLPPHLLPPPYLVDIDGHAHPAHNQEALLRLIRPVEDGSKDRSVEEVEDYDDYMRNKLAKVKEQSFGFCRARQVRVGGASPGEGGASSGGVSAGNGNVGMESGNADGEDRVKMELSSSCEDELVKRNIEASEGHINGSSSSRDGGGTGEVGMLVGNSSSPLLDNEVSVQGSSCVPVPLDEDSEVGLSAERQTLECGVLNGQVGPAEESREEARVGGAQGKGTVGVQDEGTTTEGGGIRNDGAVEGGRREEEAESMEVEVVEEQSQNGLQNVQNMLSSLVYSLGLGQMETKRLISLWHSRVIIPPLGHTQLAHDLARRQELYRQEQLNFEEENEKARRREEQAVVTVEPHIVLDQGRALRSGRTLPGTGDGDESLADRDSVAMESSEEEERESELERAWDESDSSDISDWTEEAGIDINSILRKRTKKRKRSLESIMSNNDLEEEEEGELSVKMKVSSSEQASKMKAPAKKKLHDLQAYAPPSWITNSKPVLSPYLPQVGDIVVYFNQGHKLYVDSVRAKKLYPVNKSSLPWQKFKLHPQEFCQVTNVRFTVGPPTLCSVTLALLHPLNQGVDAAGSEEESRKSQGEESGTETKGSVSSGPKGRQRDRIRFTFKLHDMDSVLDFLILEPLYKMSVRTSWEVGDRFCSLIDGKYWFGVIQEKKPFSEEYSSSFWQCFYVLWDDGATDHLSPWDMEPIPQQNSHSTSSDNQEHLERKAESDSDGGSSENEESAAVLCPPAPSSRLRELLSLQQAVVKEAWGGEEELARILHGLELVKEMDEAYMFLQPVDLEQISDYCKVVPFPTDLKTIRVKLENGLYRRKQALLWELMLIAKNAVAFNEEDSLIVKHARVLVQTLGQFINAPGVTDPMDCYAPEPRGEVEDEVDLMVPEEEVVFVDPLELPPPAVRESPVKNISKKPSTSSFSHASSASAEASHTGQLWLEKAEQLLEDLVEQENAEPFLEPVDMEQYTDYLDHVREPMDFGTIERKISAACYTGPQELVSDIRLVFTNSRLYNRKGSEMYKITTELQSYFERRLPQCLQGYISHPYKTRNAAGKLDLATNARSASARTSSISSLEDSSLLSAGEKNGGRHRDRRRLRRGARESTGAGVSAAKRSRRKLVEADSMASSDSDEENNQDHSNGSSSSTRSNSGSSGSYGRTQQLPQARIQTRSMQKDTSASQSRPTKANGPAAIVEKDFSMTLRVRSCLKRKRFYDSEEESSGEEEEEKEMEADGEEDSGLSAEEEVAVGKRPSRVKAKSTSFNHAEGQPRNLRKRPRTKYFEDEDDRI